MKSSPQKAPAVRRPSRPAAASEAPDSAAVDAYFAQLSHPLKTTLAAVRSALLAADPAISEGIKWNSPSFYREGWFATMNLQGKQGPLLVFHLGAKGRAGVEARQAVPDPAGLLQWLGADRAVVSLADPARVTSHLAALQALAREWSRLLV